jgi:hypothetical protein
MDEATQVYVAILVLSGWSWLTAWPFFIDAIVLFGLAIFIGAVAQNAENK